MPLDYGPEQVRRDRARVLAVAEEQLVLLRNEYNDLVFDQAYGSDSLGETCERLQAAIDKLRQGKVYDLDDLEVHEVESALDDALRVHPAKRPPMRPQGLPQRVAGLFKRGQDARQLQDLQALDQASHTFRRAFGSASLARPDVVLTQKLAERLKPELAAVEAELTADEYHLAQRLPSSDIDR